METTEHRIGHGHNQSLLVVDTDQRAPVCTVWHSGHRLGNSVEEQQWPGLERLFCLVGKKLVAVPNQRSLVLYAEGAGVKRACGNSRIDHLPSNFEKCQRLSIGVEVTSIDSRHGAAFFHKRFCVRPFEAELHAAEDAREKQLGIEANQLQINGMFRLGALQTYLTKRHTFVNRLPAAGIGNGQCRTALESIRCRWLR